MLEVYKPGSVHNARLCSDHLSRGIVTNTFMQPTQTKHRNVLVTSNARLYLVLLQVGFT